MKYINKDAVMAEIERRINFFTEESGNSNSDIVIALFGLKSFIDTLEVKDVVDAEIIEVEDDNYSMCGYTHLEIDTDEDLDKICKAGDKAKVIIIK